MRRWMATMAILVATSAGAMTLSDYVAALESIRAADDATSRAQAQQLLGAGIDSPAGRFTADASLLHEVIVNPTAARAHVDAAIAALRAAAPQGAANADARLLERLRKQEETEAMKAGGEVPTLPADEKSLETAANGLAKFWKWLGKWFDKLADWASRWLPKERPKDPLKKTGIAPRGLVTAVVLAIVVVLAVLAFEVIRRSRASEPEPETAVSDAIESRRDEDPLSRGANEWERYAAKLAAAGRLREAIRAWYHAVLVTLYAAGVLHFKKGRTNWEYIAALSPELVWRGEFVTMTRRFETEWYGRAESTADALDDAAERGRRILEAVRRRAAA